MYHAALEAGGGGALVQAGIHAGPGIAGGEVGRIEDFGSGPQQGPPPELGLAERSQRPDVGAGVTEVVGVVQLGHVAQRPQQCMQRLVAPGGIHAGLLWALGYQQKSAPGG